jgi:hypothetical protein
MPNLANTVGVLLLGDRDYCQQLRAKCQTLRFVDFNSGTPVTTQYIQQFDGIVAFWSDQLAAHLKSVLDIAIATGKPLVVFSQTETSFDSHPEVRFFDLSNFPGIDEAALHVLLRKPASTTVSIPTQSSSVRTVHDLASVLITNSLYPEREPASPIPLHPAWERDTYNNHLTNLKTLINAGARYSFIPRNAEPLPSLELGAWLLIIEMTLLLIRTRNATSQERTPAAIITNADKLPNCHAPLSDLIAFFLVILDQLFHDSDVASLYDKLAVIDHDEWLKITVQKPFPQVSDGYSLKSYIGNDTTCPEDITADVVKQAIETFLVQSDTCFQLDMNGETTTILVRAGSHTATPASVNA